MRGDFFIRNCGDEQIRGHYLGWRRGPQAEASEVDGCSIPRITVNIALAYRHLSMKN
jgi:hypothetical protein